MRRNLAVICVLIILLLSGCNLKQEEKVYRIGILEGIELFDEIVTGFKDGMTELGYVEGENIVYDVQRTNFDMETYRNVLRGFIDDEVDLIFVFPTEASMETKAITQGTGIPVVFANVFTEGTGLVDSVRAPGGDITGVRWPGPDLANLNLEFMLEFVPDAEEIWVPYQKNYPIVNSQIEALHLAFPRAGVTLIEFPADTTTELEALIEERAQLTGTPDAIMTIAEPLVTMPDAFIMLAKFADEHKIPFGGLYQNISGYTSLYGLIPQFYPQGKQASFLADKILRGTPAGTIPVVSAEHYFQLNYKKAQELGLTVPQGMLARADEIIR
jgi:putative ABC transport system substrate-binding protein